MVGAICLLLFFPVPDQVRSCLDQFIHIPADVGNSWFYGILWIDPL